MPKQDYVHFRTSKEMRDRLDATVDDLRRKGINASRSSVARTLLETALGNKGAMAEVEEVMRVVHHLVQRALGRAEHDLVERATSYLKDELQAIRKEA